MEEAGQHDRARESGTSVVLSRTRINCTFAPKEKPFARRMSRKRSWSLSFLPYPMRRVPRDGHRVDGRVGPLKEGDLLPFRGFILQFDFSLCNLSVLSVIEPQGCRFAPTAGLKLANAFGV